ncbi:helix-turn-helix domain-containing protein [Humibacter sp. RRB41]|uniref:helix-turn-helix domain-containing protein n=1 Tax=Humibacter sp. RRB41 TaxID=2919946 RepID=UPI0035B1B633
MKVSSWVWHDSATAKLNGNEMILLLALADVADDNGRCRFMANEDDLTYDGLARKVRVDRRTIERLIPSLRHRGLLTHAKGSKSRPNEFAIAVPWAQTSTDKVSGNGSDSPTAESLFPDTVSVHTSLIRIDVNPVTDAFDSFWSMYPRKVAKEGARSAFVKAAKRVGSEVILEGARRFAADPNLPEKKFIPHPMTWLNRGSWDDELLPERNDRPGVTGDDFGVDEWMMRA